MSDSDASKQDQRGTKKGTLKEFFRLGEVANYFFRRKNPDRPSNVNLKMMHGINRLAIFIFIVGVLYLIIKRLF